MDTVFLAAATLGWGSRSEPLSRIEIVVLPFRERPNMELASVPALDQMILTCGTILLQASAGTAPPSDGAVPVVLTATAKETARRLRRPAAGCTVAVLGAGDYRAAERAALRARPEVRLAVAARSAEEVELFADTGRLESLVFFAPLNGTGPVAHRRLSPFDASGRAKDRSIPVAYTVLRPYIIRPKPMVGMDADVWREVSKHLGLKVEYQYFTYFRDMIKSLKVGNSSVGLSNGNFEWRRYQNLDLSLALTMRKISISSRQPVPVDSFYTIVYPFTPGVWAAMALTVVAVAATISLLNWRYGYEAADFRDVSIAYVPLVSESLPHEWFGARRHRPYVPVFFLWLLIAFVSSQAYKSNLLAMLAKVSYERPLDTFQALLDRGMEMHLPRGAVTTLLLRFSPNPVHRRVYQEALVERGGFFDGFVPPPEVLRRMLAGRAGGIGAEDAFAGYNHLFRNSREPLFVGPAGYYYRLKVPLKGEIESALHRMMESGVLSQLRRRADWVLARPERDYERATPPPPRGSVIAMSHTYPMLILLAAGLAASAAAFAAEAAGAAWRRAGKWRQLASRRPTLTEVVMMRFPPQYPEF